MGKQEFAYSEFVQMTGDEVSASEFEKICFVYASYPNLQNLSDLADFWKKNGKMTAIELIYPLSREFGAALEREFLLKCTVVQLRDSYNVVKEELDTLENLIDHEVKNV